MFRLYLLENSKTETGSEEFQQKVRSHKEWEKNWVVISFSSSKCLFAPDVCIKY